MPAHNYLLCIDFLAIISQNTPIDTPKKGSLRRAALTVRRDHFVWSICNLRAFQDGVSYEHSSWVGTLLPYAAQS